MPAELAKARKDLERIRGELEKCRDPNAKALDLIQKSMRQPIDAATGALVKAKPTSQTATLAEKLPPCVVGMEACCGAHHLGLVFAAHGHDVRLMSPEYVRPTSRRRRTTIETPRGSRRLRRGRRCALSN